jgi:multidrug efflux system outer membrane protein
MLAALAGLASGCVPLAVTPDAALDVPAAYRFAGKQGGLEDHATDWWSGFRSAELTRLMEETEIANLDIAAAIGRVKQADAQASQSGAALLPGITSSDSLTRSLSSTNALGSSSSRLGGGSVSADTQYLASFSASYQLDFWGKNRATLVAAQDNATATRWDRRTVTLTSLASSATTYYTVLAARERIAFAKQDVTDSSHILKLIEDRQKAGTASALDVAQQAALVANLKASIPPLQVTEAQNIAALGILLGVPPERVALAANSVMKAHVPVIAPGLPSEVLIQRPDVQFAEYQLSSEHASLVAARAAFFPTITLTAQGGFESLALQTLLSPASTFYSAAASLSQPIFDGGLLQGQFDQVKGRQDELLADYKKAVITAFSDVDKALSALKLLAEQEELTRQSLVASKKAYDLSEQRLNSGIIDVVTLLQTEQTLFTTQDTLVQVRLSRLTEAVALYQALGGAYAGKLKSGT